MEPPIVIDNGSCTIKAGIAGQEKPAVILPNVVGRPKHVRIMDGGALGSGPIVGSKALLHRGALSLQHPMERSMVAADSWDDMELVWRHLLGSVATEESLGVDATQRPVLLTEAPLTPHSDRQKCAEVMFESFSVPGLHVALPAVLTLYAAGDTTGLVVDSGEGVTSIVPVYEGHALPKAVQRLEIAGYDVTQALRLHLRRASFISAPASSSSSSVAYGSAFGPTLHTSAELEVVRELKEAACYVAKDPKAEAAAFAKAARAAPGGSAISSSNSMTGEYRLPDGHLVRLGEDRFQAAEVLFKPSTSLGGFPEQPGIHEGVALALHYTEVDLRETMLASMHLAGGTTCMRGFGDRLLAELRQLTPPSTHIRISAPATRKTSAWTGGSIYASLSTFQSALVTKAEWEEHGASILKSKWAL